MGITVERTFHHARDAWQWAISGSGRRFALPPLLLLIVAVALALRLYGIGWDQGHFFHPDERSIFMRVDCMYRVLTNAPFILQDCIREFPQTVPGVPTPSIFLDAARSPLNPHWFPLGSIIIYLLLIVRVALSPLVHMDLGDLAMAGRTLSALADVGSVILVYVLGRRIFSQNVGLLAAGMVSLAVIHIQNSHYYRPETFTALFVLAAFWFMLQVMDRRRLRDSAFLGLFVGLAFATKISVLPLLFPLALTYGFLLYKAGHRGEGASPADTVQKVMKGAMIGGAVAVVTFLFWVPYSVLALPEFLEWTFREAGIAGRAGEVPYTIQYIGAPKFLYELQQTSLWALGLPLGVMVWGGLLFTVVRNFLKAHRNQILLLLWVVPLFLIVGNFETKFLRYSFPLMPFLILLGSGAVFWILAWVREHRPRVVPVTRALILVVVVATAFYALAFEMVYSRPHTAVQASRWINDNVPHGTTILSDNHWDEGIPDLGRYRVTQLPMYEGDTEFKMRRVAQELAEGEYLVSYSNRPYGSIARVPDRYPASSRYYQLLFSGQLGYRLEKSFTSYPALLGVAFKDDTFTRAGLLAPQEPGAIDGSPLTLNLGYADENVIDYDHPKVLLFKNVDHLPESGLIDLLRPGERPVGLLLSSEELEIQLAGGTWSSLFSPEGFTNRFPLPIWLLLVEALFVAALPLSLWVFRFLPDRGVVLARPLGILVVAYLTWMAASLGWLTFSRGTFVVALLAVALLSAVVVITKGADVRSFLAQRWRYMLGVEGIFLVAFLSFFFLRLAVPDLWHPYRGGEKPLDFAYLNAIIRSTTMPPYDPWFAGGYINYYYFGQFISATLTKVTGIVPAVAYNLLIPLFFALTVTCAFSLVYNLAEALRRRRFPQASLRGPILAGLAGLFFVVVMGNLGGAVQLLEAGWNTLVNGDSFPAFDFWRSSRMMPGQFSITEFPFWTFLFADLHAHLMAIPFTLLALGLALNLVLAPKEDTPTGHRGMRNLLAALGGPAARILFLALAVGSLASINSWDFPPYMAMAVVALGIGQLAHRRGLDGRSLGRWVVQALLLVGLAYLLFLPFHHAYQSAFTGVKVSDEQTPFYQYLGIHGLFFLLAFTFLLVEGTRRLGWRPWALIMGEGATGVRNGVLHVGLPLVGLVTVGPALAFAILLGLLGYETVGVLLLLLILVAVLAAWWLLHSGGDAPVHLFLLLLLGLAFAIGTGVDLVTVQPDIDRMNTVFKLYLQGWMLYGVASAFILWYLVTSGLFRPWRRLRHLKSAALTLVALLLLSSSVFPLLGTRARLQDRFHTLPLTLDGTAYTQDAVYLDPKGHIELRWDAQAMRWLQQNIQGSPVILEAALSDQYRWGSRVSIYTGLPTVVGWKWHQEQQRGRYGFAVGQRHREVAEMYTTTDTRRALDLMQRYDVSYVYVGPVERLYHSGPGLEKFDAWVGDNLELVYPPSPEENPQVKIYRVLSYQP